MIHFTVRPPHQNLYPVCLPPWLPDDVLEKMIQRFGRKLYDELQQLPDIDDIESGSLLAVRGHKKSLSLESAGESVSSAGSNDMVIVDKDVD